MSVKEFEHLDLTSITTPVNVSAMEELLSVSGYDPKESKFLVNGFSEGFDFMYRGPMNKQDTSKNLPFHCGNNFEMWDKIMSEVEKAKYAGPFNEIPFDNYIQSPIGLVPKAQGKTRLIFHLSYRFEQSGNPSVNECTPREFCRVRYNDLDSAVEKSLKLINMIQDTLGVKPKLFYGKSDLKSAFRILLGKPDNFWIFIMMAKHPITARIYYFVDKCMAFGHSISCALFQRFSNALAHMLRFLVKVKINWDPLTNYLDDFLFIAFTRFLCNYILETFIEMCNKLKVPVSEEKTEMADTQMTFLGVLLDGECLVLVITEEKRTRTLNLLLNLKDRKKATIKEIQSLAGLLNFLNKAVFPGRAFTRRMYAKFSGPANQNLKPHHHIRLDREFKSDCEVWINFLGSSRSAVCRPFVDLGLTLSAEVLDLFTDAAKGESLGMGGVFGRHWFFARWEPEYIKTHNPSIEYLELLGVCTAVFI